MNRRKWITLFSELRHFTWTGDNQFFCMASKDSLVIGAGGGHNGLWLDGKSFRNDLSMT